MDEVLVGRYLVSITSGNLAKDVNDRFPGQRPLRAEIDRPTRPGAAIAAKATPKLSETGGPGTVTARPRANARRSRCGLELQLARGAHRARAPCVWPAHQSYDIGV